MSQLQLLCRFLCCCCCLLTLVLLLLSLEPCDDRDPRLAAASTAAAAAAVTAALGTEAALRCASVGGFELDLFDDLLELAELMAELVEDTSEARGMCQ